MSEYDRERTIRKAQQSVAEALGVTLYETRCADDTMSAQWVRVSTQDLAEVASRLMDAEDERDAARVQANARAALRVDLSAARDEVATLRRQIESVRRQWGGDVARADKAERELAEACAEIATLNRHVAELEAYRRAMRATLGNPAPASVEHVSHQTRGGVS